MNYLQYHFKIDPATEAAADVLAALLADAGFESFEPTDDGLTAYVQTALLNTEALKQAIDFFPLPDTTISYTSAEAPNQNWNAQWEREVGFDPILVGRRFVVLDDRHTTPIRIRPEQAFGSGSHATTRMILEWLSNVNIEGCTVIDAGCGTGILGIAAMLSGAEQVFAYDIDEWSVRNAQTNATLNGVTLDVRHGDASVLACLPQADLILANINRNILLADMHAFVSRLKPSGTLVLSGFMAEDIPLLTEAAGAEGLILAHTANSDLWQMLVFSSPLPH